MMLRKTKIVAGMSLVFLVCCIVGAGIFVHKVSEQKEVYVRKEQERLRILELEKSIDALTQTLERTRSEREFLLGRILSAEEDGVISLLALIGQLGREQGVLLETQSITTEALSSSLADTFEYLSIHFTMTGSYEQVHDTLRVLEHLPYQVVVANARLTRSNATSAEWTAFVELRFTKFVQQ